MQAFYLFIVFWLKMYENVEVLYWQRMSSQSVGQETDIDK